VIDGLKPIDLAKDGAAHLAAQAEADLAARLIDKP
jgi:hypothetical protein